MDQSNISMKEEKAMKMTGSFINVCSDNWYVIQVTTGREEFIKSLILKYSTPPVTLRIFSRELIHTRQGQPVKVFDLLFPGYIFIKDEVKDIVKLIQNKMSLEFVRPVSCDGKISKVDKNEMSFLLANSDINGIFKLSYGHKEGNKINIIHGPLKGMNGKILFVNEKKKKAKIEITIFKRKINISLGLEIVNQKKDYGNYLSA